MIDEHFFINRLFFEVSPYKVPSVSKNASEVQQKIWIAPIYPLKILRTSGEIALPFAL